MCLSIPSEFIPSGQEVVKTLPETSVMAKQGTATSENVEVEKVTGGVEHPDVELFDGIAPEASEQVSEKEPSCNDTSPLTDIQAQKIRMLKMLKMLMQIHLRHLEICLKSRILRMSLFFFFFSPQDWGLRSSSDDDDVGHVRNSCFYKSKGDEGNIFR